MSAIWKEVRSEQEIDHRSNTVIVGSRTPNLMVNATARDRSGRSTISVAGGPYATLDEARAEAEKLADAYDISTIYRVAPLR